MRSRAVWNAATKALSWIRSLVPLARRYLQHQTYINLNTIQVPEQSAYVNIVKSKLANKFISWYFESS